MAEELATIDKDAVEVNQYIVVSLSNENFGIDIRYIDNIVRMQSITRVPKSSVYYRGVINLRGEVIAVMSARVKMGLDDDEITGKSRIIILKYESNESIGVLVDEVKQVVTISSEDIEKVAHEKNGGVSFISGVGKVDGGLISILDLSTIIDERREE